MKMRKNQVWERNCKNSNSSGLSALMLCNVYLFTASNNNSTDLGIVVHLIQSGDQLVHQTSAKGIESLGTV